jgi:mycofactocin precursor peptide peptidase
VTDLTSLTWPEIIPGQLVLVPIGSTEQHGPHLPFDTDTVIAEAVASAAAERVGALVAPAQSFGSSGEHQSFPGTISIGTEALRHLLIELVRSLRTWSGPVMFVNGHGGNLAALDDAVDSLRLEGHPVGWVACASEEVDLHAGHTETSVMLYLRPHLVRLDRVEPGDLRPLRQILGTMRSAGVRAVSANGVLGDPTGATPEEGTFVLDAMVESVVDACIVLRNQECSLTSEVP